MKWFPLWIAYPTGLLFAAVLVSIGAFFQLTESYLPAAFGLATAVMLVVWPLYFRTFRGWCRLPERRFSPGRWISASLPILITFVALAVASNILYVALFLVVVASLFLFNPLGWLTLMLMAAFGLLLFGALKRKVSPGSLFFRSIALAWLAGLFALWLFFRALH